MSACVAHVPSRPKFETDYNVFGTSMTYVVVRCGVCGEELRSQLLLEDVES